MKKSSAFSPEVRERAVRILVIEGCSDDDLAWLYGHALGAAPASQAA